MKSAGSWLQLSVHHPPPAAEAVGEALFELGAQGVWEDAPDSLGRVVSRAGFELPAETAIKRELPSRLAQIAAAFERPESDFNFYLEEREDHDWADKWKEGLSPITICPRLAVVPSWWPEDQLPKSEFVLRLDPGLAFGSGHHATTFLSLTLVVELAPEARRVLDVGAGSGILSLAAAAVNGSALIIGVDNDPDTIDVARENAAANGLAERVDFSSRTLENLEAGFELICANITLNPLMELAPAITRLAASGAKLVLSGLLENQWAEALSVYEPLGWGAQRLLGRQEWMALELRQGARSRPLVRQER